MFTSVRFAYIVCGLLMAVDAQGQDRPAPSVPAEIKAWLPLEAIKDQEKDDDLQKLLKARYRESVDETAAVMGVYTAGIGAGTTMLDQLIGSTSRCKDSGLELCRTPQERLALLEQNVKLRQRIEAMITEGNKAGIAPTSSYHQVKGWRIAAEIELLRAKRSAK